MAKVEAEFDKVAANYQQQHEQSIRLSGEDTGYFARYKIAVMHGIISSSGKKISNITDFGAGIGNSLPHLRSFFPDSALTAVDVSAKSLEYCDRLGLPGLQTHHYNGRDLNLPGGKQDVIFTSCVFHHIEPQFHISLLQQICCNLHDQGQFFLFEHNPWNPLTLHAVNSCPFDENAILISAPEMKRRLLRAGFRKVHIRYHLFFPKILAFLRPMERYLAHIPIGAQYSLQAIK